MKHGLMLGSFLLILSSAAVSLDGVVQDNSGKPVPFAYVGLLNPDFSPVADAITGAEGRFTLAQSAPGGYLVIQPPSKEDAAKNKVFSLQPRMYSLEGNSGELLLKLPPAVTWVLEAYDEKGSLMRWGSFQNQGQVGGQYMYAVNMEDESIPAACWPIFGALAGAEGGPREQGLPGMLLQPGETAALYMLFWMAPGYGKLMLRADNAGKGFSGKAAGDAQTILINLELARTAVADLQRRANVYPPNAAQEIAALDQRLQEAMAAASPPARAAKSDAVLAEALRLRDRLELDSARAAIPKIRQGTLKVLLKPVSGINLSQCQVSVDQENHDFIFNVFEGSPYNAKAFEQARNAGFEWATVLLGWNWTQSPALRKSELDGVFGISKLKKLGYQIKAHGVVWMQEYGILPDKARTMEASALVKAALEHQQALLDTFDPSISLWEAINEPANTNVVALPRETMMELMAKAAQNASALGKPVLVNNPHEWSYGAKYLMYGTDNQPLNDYPLTFSDFLKRAGKNGALDKVNIVGLQLYPGVHYSEMFAHLQGPAFTPAYVADQLDRYAQLGKTVHITELSMPSTYDPAWFSGYWREPWTESTQADYAEAVYTIAFAHPSVQSVGWWDISDAKPSVVTGGMIRKDGTPKPVFERLQGLLQQWTTRETKNLSSEGTAEFMGFGGAYSVTVKLPDGKEIHKDIHLLERETIEVSLEMGMAK
ncbi:MAG TPA: endo-1,4-beta-xylanase [Candidatus Hydrogenedentes bacterium]|nr:endo-1,4-beta-xylanase [Candidatus Hydrogenedentota bacterium]